MIITRIEANVTAFAVAVAVSVSVAGAVVKSRK